MGGGQALEAGGHPSVPADRSGDGVESRAGQAQLARAMDARMARQDLLDERGAGARQADDEDRAAGVVAGAGQAIEQSGREGLDHLIDQVPMPVRLVGQTTPTVLLEGQGVGAAEARGDRLVAAPRVLDQGEAEEQVGARAVVQRRILNANEEVGEVRVRQPAAEQVGESGEAARRPGFDGDGPAIPSLGLVEVAGFLRQGAEVPQGRLEVGLDLQRAPVARASLRGTPFALEGPAEIAVVFGPAGFQLDQPGAAGDRGGGILVLEEDGEQLPATRRCFPAPARWPGEGSPRPARADGRRGRPAPD